MNKYPKRLIEVDLPIKRISTHARREKSIRHGHISTLHIWWARRPLAACRAVICASLWFDPVDDQCPERFRQVARERMRSWGKHQRNQMSSESFAAFEKANKNDKLFDDNGYLRGLLLDFIADFANWDNLNNEDYLETSQALTEAAHIANGGEPGTRPLVVDPFAGGGAIPLEVLRIGGDVFASDLNPIPVLLNTVALQYIPKFGTTLADEVKKWGKWIDLEAFKEIGTYYPSGPGGETTIAYLWFRTIQCEGPGCGAEVPLMRSLWLAKKGKDSVALRLRANKSVKSVDFELIKNARAAEVGDGTIKRGAATCPCCGFTTPVTSMREQLRSRRGGADDARLIAIRFSDAKTGERSWRLPTEMDFAASKKAQAQLEAIVHERINGLPIVPNEPLPPIGTLGFRVQNYGMLRWGDLFTARQALSLATLGRLVRTAPIKGDDELVVAIRTCLALAVDRLADFNASLCVLNSTGGRGVVHVFGRQALPMVWDFMETNPFNTEAANWSTCYEVVDEVIQNEQNLISGTAEQANAANHPLPDDSVSAFITDPPYYDAVPYADLSDFFYVWLRRNLPEAHRSLIAPTLTEKDEECIVDPARKKGKEFFERQMGLAMLEGRRILRPDGIGVIVFAHKSTSGWESQLQAMIDSGWIVTGSWPIDTERPGRLRAQNSAALASSIHLVCRPRENSDGSVVISEIGDWGDVLRELPVRIHEWMPRLASEGVVGADAIFACLGPALEVFSKYSSVEKPSGETVYLREYLEHVWAAVAKEALNMIFAGADATGFEEDARLTAMWLWTLFSGASPSEDEDETEEEDVNDEENSGAKTKISGFILEYDAARKIAQGLGAHLEDLSSIIKVRGDKAILLPVGERARELFGYDAAGADINNIKKKNKSQGMLFTELEVDEIESAFGVDGAPTPGTTTLDQVHQTMLLFGAGRGEAVRRFLIDDGIGNDERFWRLANALSALYPGGSQEKRWVDGVLARKKGLGF